MKKRIVVVCPGRGSYTRDTMGYLRGSPLPYLNDLNLWRREEGDPTLSELDEASSFQPGLHTKGEHASVLIHACAASDFFRINSEKFEVAAILGNSMGWYIALSLGKALDPRAGFQVIQTMGGMMRNQIIGGQIIYPLIDAEWKPSKEKRDLVLQCLAEANQQPGAEAYISIWLGGYIVLAGNSAAIQFLLKRLPKEENYPFQLVNHAAFHTPLLQETSNRAFELLSSELFQPPAVPLIDGRGHIWQPHSTDVELLYRYTLNHQVVKPYDFTKSVEVALKEFAPDHLVLLGPGNSLGGALGQILIQNRWLGIQNKSDFQARQRENPFLISMGMSEQRTLLL